MFTPPSPLFYDRRGEVLLEREHQLSVVLADETRYRIYRSIAEQPRETVTVADVARRFGLHPNVARMHLSKLEQAGLLATGLRKTQGGGRPARLYSMSGQVSSLTVPPRRYDLLSTLALAALAQRGSDRDVVHICRDAGKAEGRRHLAEQGRPRGSSRKTSADLVRRVAEQQGLLPEVHWDGDELDVQVRNCVFAEVAATRPDLVCSMHRAFFEGLVDAVVGEVRDVHVVDDASISRGAEACELRFTVG
jgi:predicted ArsR family transcriptional regulator